MLVATTSVANASTVYTYAGNNFITIFDATPPNGTYTTGMSVTGSFTVLNPLPANSPLTDISASLLSFSFFRWTKHDNEPECDGHRRL